MTNEQREAIDSLEKLVKLRKDKTNTIKHDTCICGTMDLDTALSLIKEQQEEIEKKDKQIDLMAEWISERCFYKDDYSNSCEIMQDSCSKEDDCKHCIKQYFERKAEDEK